MSTNQSESKTLNSISSRADCSRFVVAFFGFVLAVAPVVSTAYEPDDALRKRISRTVKKELIAATPSQQRFSVRISFSTKTAFRDYERLAEQAGFPAYDDCSIATFVEVTNWQLIQGKDVEPDRIKALVKSCQANTTTAIGPKPIPQAQGDREILRGMWQRNLAFVGRTLGDKPLQAFIRDDASKQFYTLRGEPSLWELTVSGFKPKMMPASEPEPRDVPLADQPAVAVNDPSIATAVPNGIDGLQIALRTLTRYGLSGVYVENETYLLLPDGSIHRNFSDNPHTLNVAMSKQQSWEDWGRWTSRGEQIEVRWADDDPVIWKKWFKTRAARNGQSLQGRYQSADGFGGGRVANFNTVAFDADGRFSWAALKGGDTGAWLPAYSDTKRAGRYELDGYAIRLRYNDGTTEEYAFCFYPKDNQHFVIGANHFTPLD